MSIDVYSRAATEITIRPEPSLQKGRAAQQAQSSQDKMWGGDGFGFDDLIDIVNPLQHIPIVSSIYRELTGDEINPGARLAGGAMLGGVFGVMAGAANMMIEEATGDDVVGHVVAAFTGETDTAPTQMLAAKEAPAATKPAMEMAQLSPTLQLQPLNFASAEQARVPEKAKREPREVVDPLGLAAAQQVSDPMGMGAAPASPAGANAAANEVDEAVLALFDPALTQARQQYEQAKSLEWKNESTRRQAY